jgi:hypothetical protein
MGRIILRRIFEKWVRRAWTGIYLAEGFCECGSEPSSFIKCGEFPD